MSKSWLDDTVKILQVISLPIVITVTIYGAMQNYLTDFWKGFVIGALLIFFLMLILNVYFYWVGKSRRANLSVTQPPQSTSATKAVTRAPVNPPMISIDEAKKIAWNRVVSEKPEAPQQWRRQLC